jgi:hypothetical protein
MTRFETRARARVEALGALFALTALSCGNSSSPIQGGGSGTSGSGSAAASSGTQATSGASVSGATSGGTTSGVVATSGVSAGAAAGTASGDVTSGAASGASGTSSGSPSTSGGSGASTGSSETSDDGGLAMIDAAGRTLPTCTKPTPPPNEGAGALSRPSECDVLLQALDFEDAYSYPSPPGSIKVTDFGNAFGLFEINNCSPYCYAKDLTVGVDIVGGGSQADLQGEIILEFPSSGPGLSDGGPYPIPVADKTRSIYSWITFDGPAKPPFEIDTQLVVETATGIVPAVQTRPFFKANGQVPFGPFNVTNNYSYSNGSEFAYAPITGANGFPNGLVNVTGIGFRIVAKATAGQSWHGVVYIDHVQLRGPGPQNPPGWPGAYPYHDAGL